jgi:hypothetical protein
VNRVCSYDEPYRSGLDLDLYLSEMTARFLRRLPPDPGVFPIDLDCFTSLGRAELDRLERSASPAAAYVANAVRWLHDPADLEAADLPTIAARLRVPEARRRELGDPFLLLARKAETQGNLRCAERLSVMAGLFGLAAARDDADRLGGIIQSRIDAGERFPQECDELDLRGEVFSKHRPRPVLGVAVNGRCSHPRRYRNGEAVAENIRVRIELELDLEGATAVDEDEPEAPPSCLPIL